MGLSGSKGAGRRWRLPALLPTIQCTEEGCSSGKETRMPENFYTFICKIKFIRLRIKCMFF